MFIAKIFCALLSLGLSPFLSEVGHSQEPQEPTEFELILVGIRGALT